MVNGHVLSFVQDQNCERDSTMSCISYNSSSVSNQRDSSAALEPQPNYVWFRLLVNTIIFVLHNHDVFRHPISVL